MDLSLTRLSDLPVVISEVRSQLGEALLRWDELQKFADLQTDRTVALLIKKRQLERALAVAEVELYTTRADLHRCTSLNDTLLPA